MFRVKSQPLELRGIAHKATSKGKTFYIVNCEDNEGNHFQFYAPEPSAFGESLKKGSMVTIEFLVRYYNNQERLIVSTVELVDLDEE